MTTGAGEASKGRKETRGQGRWCTHVGIECARRQVACAEEEGGLGLLFAVGLHGVRGLLLLRLLGFFQKKKITAHTAEAAAESQAAG